MTIAYVEHPVTKAEKSEYRKKFDKIIDIQFAPEELERGDKKFAKPKAKPKAKAED
jgi:hypothetical protein